ncbi:MAG: glycosyltransferase family 1 protein [Candidatus Paceibacterota bacterium]|jgi:glycosyltransferase involved in cell wall biosynthesis
MRTTIGIDIRMLARGNKSGVEEYTSELLEHMLPLGGDIRFKLFYNGWKKEPLDFKWLELPNVELKEFRIPNRILDGTFRFLDLPKVDSLLGGVDKFFSPHIFLSSVGKSCEKIVTFHDLSFEKYPEFYSSQKNFWHFSMNPRQQAERADNIIAVSASTKQDLVEIYKIAPEKIKVIYSGLSMKVKKEVLPQEKIYVQKKYNLPDNYILYLGTLEPRKNIVSLLTAFDRLKKENTFKDSGLKLVIAGAKGWLYNEIFTTAQKFSSRGDIVFTGFVEDKYKPALYRGAKLFVYPSFYEGFGFPPLEAMAKGTPVVTSGISSIPEAVENAAMTVNPTSPDELYRAMREVLTDPKLSSLLSARGYERAKIFDWNKCAKETLEFIVR